MDPMAASPTPFTMVARACESDKLTLEVAGEIDASTADEFAHGVLASVRTAGDGTVITLDMNAVDFVDSTGVKALLECRKALPHGVRLIVGNPSPPVAKLLHLTRLDDLFCEDQLIAS